MRWIRLAALIALALLVLAVGGVAIYMRAAGVYVNAPSASALASTFPRLFNAPNPKSDVLAARLHLPDGFSLSVYAQGIYDARMLRTTRRGDLLVASPSAGRVLLLERNPARPDAAGGARVLLTDLDTPNGLDFHDGYLYVAEQTRVGRVRFDHDRGSVAGNYQVVIPNLPGGGNHYKKTIRFGPDGMLYLAIGSSCNVCLETDARRAALWRYAPDGTGAERYASGLRNSAGFDWRPADGALFATDNGRDMLGDDFPPCELNQIERGGFYGWPFVNGFGVLDPDYGKGHEEALTRTRQPVFGFRPHNAPLGILFPRRDRLPAAYRNAAIVALHGSWNRSKKDGYKVVSLHWEPDGRIVARDFVTGFLENDSAIGRPAELAEGVDGSIYISDDFAGAVYRVAYGEGAGIKAGGGFVVPASGKGVAQGGQALPVPPSAARARGEQLFRSGPCLDCHLEGHADGSSKIPIHNLGDRYTASALDGYLAAPKPPMPPVEPADDRAALVEYLMRR